MLNLKNRYLSSAMAAFAALSTAALIQGCDGNNGPTDCVTPGTVDNQAYVTGQGQGKSAGDTAGKALTETQGQQDAYNGGCNTAGCKGGYKAGYTYGYTNDGGLKMKGYNEAYPVGLAAGETDPTAQENGAIDGANQGYKDGVVLGRHDGYHDGYQDGYNAGFPVGQYSCSASGSTGSGNGSTQDQSSCQTQGYNNAYAQAYADAKNGNPAYQKGLVEGDKMGYQAGIPAGQQGAYNDGKTQGYNAGLSDGKADAYTKNYNASYINGAIDLTTNSQFGGKTRGYSDGYYDVTYGLGVRPIAPSAVNGTGGEGDGFHDGYVDGHDSVCPGAPFPVGSGITATTMSLRLATGSQANLEANKFMDWAKIQNGLILDIFADHSSAMMTDAEKASLATQISNMRAGFQAKISK